MSSRLNGIFSLNLKKMFLILSFLKVTVHKLPLEGILAAQKCFYFLYYLFGNLKIIRKFLVIYWLFNLMFDTHLGVKSTPGQWLAVGWRHSIYVYTRGNGVIDQACLVT